MIFHPYQRRSDWTDHIKAALIDFADRYQVAPVMIRVNATDLDTVREALSVLAVPVPIKANGGTLLDELELGRKE
jgi:hypothetical protein